MLPLLHALTIPVNAPQLGAVDQLCTANLGCGQSDVLAQLLLLVVTGLVTVVLVATFVHLRHSLAAVAEEQSRTATERQAFSRFAREVAKLEAMGPTVQLGASPGGATAVSAAVTPHHSGLERVLTAYEATVLAMSHYEEEYDEPLLENMRRELGDEVAIAVEENEQLTPALQAALVARSREAAADRERLMVRLDHEREALGAANDELARVAKAVDDFEAEPLDGKGFVRLTDDWQWLGELESRLSRLLRHRQSALQAGGLDDLDADRPSLNAYLYGSLDTTFPVLAEASALADRLRAVRRRVLLELTDRA